MKSFTREKALDISMLLLRIAIAVVFISVGGLKLFDWFGGMPGGELGTLMLIAGILEVFGGAAILLGLFTRPIAFILSGEMAFAYFMGHFAMGFWPIENHGEVAFLLCFVYLFMAAYGAGRYSIDTLIKRRKQSVVA